MHRRVLGFLLVILGGLKAASPGAFLAYLSTIGLPEWVQPKALGWLIISVEIALGGWLLVTRKSVPAAVAALALSLGTVVFVLLNPAAKPCGCFGAALEADFGKRLAVSALLCYLATSHFVDLIREQGLSRRHT